MSAFSDYLENELLDHILQGGGANYASPTTIYVALHTADPGEDATGAEVTGGSYARQSATFTVAANGAASNTADITWTDMPATTVTHVGLWDAVNAGNLLLKGALLASKTLNSGDSFTISAGDLDIGLD